MAQLDDTDRSVYREAFERVVDGLRRIDAGSVGSFAGFVGFDSEELEVDLESFLAYGERLLDSIAGSDRDPESAYQFLALVSNNLTLLHDTATVAVGDGTQLSLPIDIAPAEYALLVEQHGGLDELDIQALGIARRSAVDVLADAFNAETSTTRFVAAFVDPDDVPPVVRPQSLSAMAGPVTADDLVGEIVGGCSDAVRQAIAGALTSGVLDSIEAGRLVGGFVDQITGRGSGPWWKRFVTRIIRETTRWFKKIVEALGLSLPDVAERFVDWILKASKIVDTAVGYALDRRAVVANIGGRAGNPAELATTAATFSRGMTLLDRSGTIVTAVAGAFLAGPAVGPVAAIVVSLIALWLASDHIGFPVGLFRGVPDFHDTDIAGALD